MKFTFFHVLNGDKVVTNMEKAKFEEKGPYAYRVIGGGGWGGFTITLTKLLSGVNLVK